MSSKIPLLVDLDGSLIRTDTLHESAVLFIKNKPWMVFLLLIWYWQGKHILKQKLAEQTRLDVSLLPVRKDLLAYLEAEKNSGRVIILCTGSWQGIAQRFAELYPVFDSVMATDDQGNLTGKNKAKAAVERFGKQGFDYLGNEAKDLIVWREARRAVVVGDESLAEKARAVTEVERVFVAEKATLKTYMKAMRVHQWAKNLLLFVPLVVSHKLSNLPLFVDAIIAFVAFGLCASATYLFNDILDLEADRKHHSKCHRAVASGAVSIVRGVIVFFGLMALGLGLAVSLNGYFVAALAIYLVITILYSFKLKKLHTVDVVVLASLFTIRVVAGAAAILVSVSFWLLSFSMFMFLSLAIVKRVSELIRSAEVQDETQKQGSKISGRGYYASDIVILQSLGCSAGFMAVLVMAFYINSRDVITLYRHPEVLWLICPIIGYWVMRVWVMTARGEMNEDPISFAISDQNSWYSGLVIVALLVFATVL